MCGIAGIIGKQDKQELSLMLDKISHRGPNGLFSWHSDSLSLGHARLSIIDLSANANQPMVDYETGNVLVFNGEIYNYIELKNELKNHFNFTTDSDTEVLLAAMKVYGIDCLKKLRGMFSFAFFNKQSKTIQLVRDRFGIKPLYYYTHHNNFYFSSEIKSFLSLPNTSFQINQQKAIEFLADCQLDTDDETMFQGINQLTPGYVLTINENGEILSKVSYWDFPRIGEKSFDVDAQHELVDVFKNTISVHLRSDVPIGAFFSGGVDSGTIVSFALQQKDVLPTFSGILPYHHPENNLIKEYTKQEKIIPHYYALDGEDYFQDIYDVIYHHDEPTMDGSVYSHYKLCKLASDQNIKVLLSGSGGDELFGGYASHIHGYHANLIKSLKIRDYIKEIGNGAKHSGMSAKELIFKSVYDNIPVSFKKAIKNLQLKIKLGHLEAEIDVPHYYHCFNDRFYEAVVNNYKSWTAPAFLHYEDRNSMAFGIEARVPYFDHELIEFVMQYNCNEIMLGRSKSMMRSAFKNVVPDYILNQKGKYGFPSPIDGSLKNDVKGKKLFFSLCMRTPLLNPEKTHQLGLDFYNGKVDISIFWRTFSYMIWYDIFFKGNRTPEI
jgi:asparagine synthase (glutamine-hydrolysing)